MDSTPYGDLFSDMSGSEKMKWDETFCSSIIPYIWPDNPDHADMWHGESVPTITLLEYIRRLRVGLNLDKEDMTIAYIYLSRLVATGAVNLNWRTVHRLLMCSVVLAQKWHQDEPCEMVQYCRVGGVTVDEMSSLEADFLAHMGYAMHVPAEMYFAVLETLLFWGESHLPIAYSQTHLSNKQPVVLSISDAVEAGRGESPANDFNQSRVRKKKTNWQPGGRHYRRYW